MKTKILLLASACLLNCSIVFGQRQQTTEDYNPSPAGFPTTGKRTYSYIIGEDGKKLKDGSFSISAKPDILVVDKGFSRYAVSNNGYFKLNTTFVKGNLHGALTSSFSVTVTKQGLAGNASSTCSMTFSGNFSGGLPHGAFNIKYDTDSNDKLVATYNKGVLVGAYSSSGIYKNLPCIVKGTLTSKGELTGKWTIEDLKNHIYEFQNGVLIRETSEEEATRPAITELAKKYAAGAITEAELEKHSIIVLEDSIPLGSFAWNVIFRDEVFDIQDVGGYDFSNPNNKRYKYLIELPRFNEEGFDLYTQRFDEILSTGNFDKCWENIGILNGNLVIMDENLEVCSPYINANGLKDYERVVDIYFTKEQTKIWEDKMFEAKIQHATSFGMEAFSIYRDYIKTSNYNDFNDLRERAIQIIENGDISEKLKDFIPVPGEPDYIHYGIGDNIFNSIPFITKESVEQDTITIYLLAGKYEDLVKGADDERKALIEKLQKEINDKLLNCAKISVTPFSRIVRLSNGLLADCIENPTNELTFTEYTNVKLLAEAYILDILPKFKPILDGSLYEFSFNDYSHYIFNKEDVYLMYVLAGRYNDLDKNEIKRPLIIENFKKNFESTQNKVFKKKFEVFKKKLEPLFDKLLNQSAFSISYNDNIGDLFSSEGLPENYWQLELEKRLKPFCKIVNYEIVGPNGENSDEIVCVITTLKKKKETKRKVIWKIEGDAGGRVRIIASSIDINKATLITE